MKKGWLRHLDFMVVDAVSAVLALLLTRLIISLFGGQAEIFWQLYLLMPLAVIFSGIMLDAYDLILQRGYLKEFISLLKLDFFVVSLLLLLFYFLKLLHNLPRSVLVIYFLIQFPATYIWRFAHKFYLRRHYSNIKYSRQIVVATTAHTASEMIRSITGSAIRNYQFFGLAVLDRSMTGQQIGPVTVAADQETLIDYIKENVVDEVFINLPDDPYKALALSNRFLEMGLTVHIHTEDPYQSLPNRRMSNIFGYDVVSAAVSPISLGESLVKRFFDILGGIAGCIITILIGIVIGPVIYIKSPGSILFSQIRIGKNGRPFKIYKFRSMYLDAEERKNELMKQNKIKDGFMFKMDDDPRVIKGIGSFIRKTSLDEFPQFWNVLKGDMSMVGTRPPTVDEYTRYSPHHKKRLCMKPGITGLWQVSGRSSITDFEEIVRLDTQYIENWSLELDVKIILKTVLQVFKGKDAC